MPDLTTPISQLGTTYKMYAKRLEKLEILTLEDLLFHLPFRYEDRSQKSEISRLQAGEEVTITGTVDKVANTYTRKRGFTIQNATVSDETGTVTCVWFNQPYITRAIKQGATISVTGTVDTPTKIKVKEFEILHPDQKGRHTGRLVPQYPSTKNVSVKWLRNRIFEQLQHLDIADPLSNTLREEHDLIPLNDALTYVHFPKNEEEAQLGRQRLAFDELLLSHLAAQHQKKQWKDSNTTKPLISTKHEKKIQDLIKTLPFTLTKAQQDALKDIKKDFEQEVAMNRLLQGDVGSGKTVVAALAMYITHLNGYQSALLAPTEILATQHFTTIQRFLEPLGIKVALFTSSVKKSHRKDDFDIAVGTHALLHESVNFENLAFLTIDEQQRFGVEQRAIMREKGTNPHLLTMTATPIPRTAFLTLYGELSQTYLDEMPKGRKIIKTWVVPKKKRDDAYTWIAKHIDEGKEKKVPNQVFVLCPFIDESETLITVKAATAEYEKLKSGPFKNYNVALLHGRMKAKEKETILSDFRDHKYDILVTTPVVEVGIDIPDATIMMIEGADRFGLAQLHQLRGRVGRNDRQSYCLLFTENETKNTLTRLKHLENTHLGAQLAEIDLKLRGPGQMYGTQQSGHTAFKVANLTDAALITKTQRLAESLIKTIEAHELLHNKLKSTIIRKISRD